jgi:hypothetical protein
MESAFGVSHPAQPVRKSAPKLKKLSKSLLGAGVKAANRGSKGVRGVPPAMSAGEAASYKAAQLGRMKQAFTGNKQVAVRPKPGALVSTRVSAPKPQLAIGGPKAPSNLPAVRQGPVKVANRSLVRSSGPAGGVLLPTRVIPAGAKAGAKAGGRSRSRSNFGAAASAGAANLGSKLRSGATGRLKSLRKPAAGSPAASGARQVKSTQVSPLAATLVGGGVLGGGALVASSIRNRPSQQSSPQPPAMAPRQTESGTPEPKKAKKPA